ncbi:hypothetical protein [Cypionkella aquatica]|nr:hypothetical protein [Cypionkella aquatica]
MRSGVAGVVMGLMAAAPAWAECGETFSVLFSCAVPERDAVVELCRDDSSGAVQYSYMTSAATELQFISPTAYGVVREQVQGITGPGYGMAASNGGTFYAIYVDRSLMFSEQAQEGARSSTPAVVQVYASEAALNDQTQDKYIARRVCYPPSIDIDSTAFGPG